VIVIRRKFRRFFLAVTSQYPPLNRRLRRYYLEHHGYEFKLKSEVFKSAEATEASKSWPLPAVAGSAGGNSGRLLTALLLSEDTKGGAFCYA